MVARAGHGLREVAEDAAVVVLDGRGFAVHELRGADDLGAEGCADGLVAEADAERGICSAAGSCARRWMSGIRMPASCGVQGPGESRMREGRRAMMSSGVSSSLRFTVISFSPSSPMYWTRL